MVSNNNAHRRFDAIAYYSSLLKIDSSIEEVLDTIGIAGADGGVNAATFRRLKEIAADRIHVLII